MAASSGRGARARPQSAEHAPDELAYLLYGCCIRRTGDDRPGRESPWPERYLVALWTTMSAPAQRPLEMVCRTCCPRSGQPAARVNFEISGISATRKSGLEMDSTMTARGFI